MQVRASSLVQKFEETDRLSDNIVAVKQSMDLPATTSINRGNITISTSTTFN